MTEDQALGAIVGLAIGDALGTTLEFSRNPSSDRSTWHTEITGGGPFALKPGGWTDDTSMALALMQSYLDCGEFHPAWIGRAFVNWYRKGSYSHTGTCFDIGHTTREALDRIDLIYRGSAPFQGSTDPNTSGNGGIMRLAPAVVANCNNLANAIRESIDQSRITHASPECVLYAELLAKVLYHGDPFIPDVAEYVLPDETPWDELRASGYVKDTFTCAMWAARNTNSFEECLIHTVNRRGDADTTGAVAGQIAGAMYGLSGIPERWLEKLIWREEIEENASDLYSMGLYSEDDRRDAREEDRRRAQTELFPTTIVKMISKLHILGYESLYLYSGMSPSGLNWRYEIGIQDSGNWPSRNVIASGSLDTVNTTTDWSEGIVSVEELTDRFVKKYESELAPTKVPNHQYSAWFFDVVRDLNRDSNGLLVFYADYEAAHSDYLRSAPGYIGDSQRR